MAWRKTASRSSFMIRWLTFCRRFVQTRVPTLKTLAPNTFFGISELSEQYKTPGHVSVTFRDGCEFFILALLEANSQSGSKHLAWEEAHIREGKIPVLPDIPEDQKEEDLTVIDGDNKSAEWWEEVCSPRRSELLK
jgi:hypothetical protein